MQPSLSANRPSRRWTPMRIAEARPAAIDEPCSAARARTLC
jgi:hypothetical protein